MADKEVANVYASALLELGQEKNILPRIEEELGLVASLFSEDNDLLLYLVAPRVSAESKKNFFDKAFSGKLSDTVLNFLKLSIDNNRQGAIGEIHDSLKELIDDANNRLRVKVTTARQLSDEMKGKITKALADRYGKEIILEDEVDETIIGGVIMRVGDVVIDSSLAKDIKILRDKLLISKVRSEAVYED